MERFIHIILRTLGFTHGEYSKKSMVVLLRWVLIIACSYLILFSQTPSDHKIASHLLVLFLLCTNLLIAALPSRLFEQNRFEHLLVAVDIALITAGIWLSGQVHSDLYLLYFLIIMVAAVGETLRQVFYCAALVAVIYFVMALVLGGVEEALSTKLLVRIPFLFIVALFYGYFAQKVRLERRQKAEYKKQLGSFERIREVSNLLGRSLDRTTVLQSLVECAKEFCQVEYAAVVSRGSEELLAEYGNSRLGNPERKTAMFLTELSRRLAQPGEAFAADSGPQVLAELQLEKQSGATVCFINDACTLLPVNGHADSDLYLCMLGRVSAEHIEYMRLLLVTATMALSNAGQYQALIHEVEMRQEVVKQLETALKFKSEFVANISHELRTPIYSFLGFAELLHDGGYGQLNEEQQGVVRRMCENGKNLLELINNILDYSKIEAGEARLKSTKDDLRRFVGEIHDTCLPLLRSKAVTMHAACEGSPPPLETDWSVLRQIALNLVSNAIKFTQKGRVEIEAGYRPEEETIYLRVRDTGLGIQEDQIPVIFEPFRQLENSYTKRYAGTGLGLAITKRQVDMLHGKILVESVFGEGSEFTVIVPVAAASANPSISSLSAAAPCSGSTDDSTRPFSNE